MRNIIFEIKFEFLTVLGGSNHRLLWYFMLGLDFLGGGAYQMANSWGLRKKLKWMKKREKNLREKGGDLNTS